MDLALHRVLNAKDGSLSRATLKSSTLRIDLDGSSLEDFHSDNFDVNRMSVIFLFSKVMK